MPAEIQAQQAAAASLHPVVTTNEETIDDLIALVLMSGAYLKLADEWDLDTAYEVSQHVHDIAERLFERNPDIFNHQVLARLSGHPHKFPADHHQEPNTTPNTTTTHDQHSAQLVDLLNTPNRSDQ